MRKTGKRRPAALVAAALCLVCAPDAAAECPWDCDRNNDDNVGITDFLALFGQWAGPGACDFDGNDLVGISGFLELMGSWGPCNALFTWNVDASGSWTEPSNWSPGLLPGPGDSAVIDRPAGDCTVTVSAAAFARGVQSAERLTLANNGKLTVVGTVRVSDDFTLASGTLVDATVLPGDVGQGVIPTNSGTLDGATVAIAGAFGEQFVGLNFAGGNQHLSGTGDVFLNDPDSFAPGNGLKSTVSVTIDEFITVHGGPGTLGGGGTADLDGTLTITLADGYTPSLGNTFDVVTYGSLVGTFTTINGLDIGGGLALAPTYLANALRLIDVSAR